MIKMGIEFGCFYAYSDNVCFTVWIMGGSSRQVIFQGGT